MRGGVQGGNWGGRGTRSRVPGRSLRGVPPPYWGGRGGLPCECGRVYLALIGCSPRPRTHELARRPGPSGGAADHGSRTPRERRTRLKYNKRFASPARRAVEHGPQGRGEQTAPFLLFVPLGRGNETTAVRRKPEPVTPQTGQLQSLRITPSKSANRPASERSRASNSNFSEKSQKNLKL